MLWIAEDSTPPQCVEHTTSDASEESMSGTSVGVNKFHFFSGNVSRIVDDLRIFGNSSGQKLTFSRHFSSRASNPPYHFGSGSLWRHSFQFDLVDAQNG